MLSKARLNVTRYDSNMRAVKVAGIDVSDPELHNFTQDRERTVVIGRRSEHMRTGQLHGAVPIRVTIKSSGSLNLPPGSVVEAIVFKLEIKRIRTNENGEHRRSNVQCKL